MSENWDPAWKEESNFFFFQGRKGCLKKKKKGTNFILVEVVNFCYQVLTSVEDISCSFSVGAQAAIH